MSAELLSRLCSRVRLERDSALNELTELIPRMNDDEMREFEFNLDELQRTPKSSWEEKYGYLTGAQLLIDASKATSDFVYRVQNATLDLLLDEEPRVRAAAGIVLGSVCRLRGPIVYGSCQSKIIDLILNSLERRSNSGNPEEGQLIGKITRSNSSEEVTAAATDMTKIYHDSAGWHNLESHVKCLQLLVEGCGDGFLPYINDDLVQLVFALLKHKNRFVRESGFGICSALISCNSNDISGPHPMFKYNSELCNHIAYGLSDNWSEVRKAASIATRHFLCSIQPIESRIAYFPQLLPAMCLNRYHLADGVRLYSQETWGLIVGQDGRRYVKEFINDIVRHYIAQSTVENYAIREASCYSMAELAAKIDKDAVVTYVGQLFEAILLRLKDSVWTVRVAASAACGNLLTAFPEDSKPSLERLYPQLFENLSDVVPSVRQSAADLCGKVVIAYGLECFQNIFLPYLMSGLKKVDEQPVQPREKSTSHIQDGPIKIAPDTDSQQSHITSSFPLQTGTRLNAFVIVKRESVNDSALLNRMVDQRTASTVVDGKLPTVEPWEMTNDCVFLLAELATAIRNANPEKQKELEPVLMKLSNLLPSVVNAIFRHDYVQHVQLMETVLRQMLRIANALGKRYFKPYLDDFFVPIFYGLTCGTPYVEAAAGDCLRDLAKYLGPSILKAKIEALQNPKFTSLLDRELTMAAQKPNCS